VTAPVSRVVSLSDSEILGSGVHNIRLASGATLNIDDTAPSIASAAAGYGMICDATVTVSSCDALDLSGNGSGTHAGCETSCGDSVTPD